MTTDRHQIQVGGIGVEIVRKDIKNLHVGVYPPVGRVRVAAPWHLDDEAVRLAVVSRLRWIQRKRKEFAGQKRQSQREMVNGESHYFLGRRVRLRIKESHGASGVRLVGKTIMELHGPPDSDREQRDEILQRWYRRQLRAQLPDLLAKWEPKLGEKVAEVRIKRMKTRWGSCNASARRIWLNLELIKKPAPCLEFILVHEMVHFTLRHHDERFRERMDALMPQWSMIRDELNSGPLAHECWLY